MFLFILHQVKFMVTPSRVSMVICAVYIILISMMVPIYFYCRLGMKYFPENNKTIIGLVTIEDRHRMESIYLAFNNAVSFSAFALVITCAIILVMKLQISAKWGQTVTETIQSNAYNRNLRVAKRILMISTLFIVCSLPVCAAFIAIISEPGLDIHGQYRKMVFVSLGFCVIVESINSSGNIFIYYHMSGRYKAVFREIFRVIMKTRDGS